MKKLKNFEANLVMLFIRLLKKKQIKSTGKNFSVLMLLVGKILPISLIIVQPN